MSWTLADLRRRLAQRMRYWGGDVSSGSSGSLSAGGTTFTAIDTTRPEPDDEWNDSYIVFSPGTTSAVWRRIASQAGYVLSTGTMTFTSALAQSTTQGTAYELYKVFRPEEWKVAINWALQNSYPQRHRKVIFEVPLDSQTRIYDWQQLAASQSVADPLVAPTITVQNVTTGAFTAGSYSFAYSYYNAAGETLVSPVTTVTVALDNTIEFGQLTIPDTALGVNYYGSIEPGSTKLALMDYGNATIDSAAPQGAMVGIPLAGVVYGAVFNEASTVNSVQPSAYNTTGLDVMDLHSVQRRMNPGQEPESWQDLGAHLWKPIGGTAIQLEFRPWGLYNLRFICTALPQTLNAETDTTSEPLELILAGAEYYLWDLLSKSSTVVGANWKDLLTQAGTRYNMLKNQYAFDQPRQTIHRPFIIPQA